MCAWNVSVLDKEIMMRKVTFEIKRKMIQVAAFGYSNLYLGNFLDGRLYKGKWKSFCNPGMNCYSCPAATTACPIGAMQAVNGSIDFKTSFYVWGMIPGIRSRSGTCGLRFFMPVRADTGTFI